MIFVGILGSCNIPTQSLFTPFFVKKIILKDINNIFFFDLVLLQIYFQLQTNYYV